MNLGSSELVLKRCRHKLISNDDGFNVVSATNGGRGKTKLMSKQVCRGVGGSFSKASAVEFHKGKYTSSKCRKTGKVQPEVEVRLK